MISAARFLIDTPLNIQRHTGSSPLWLVRLLWLLSGSTEASVYTTQGPCVQTLVAIPTCSTADQLHRSTPNVEPRVTAAVRDGYGFRSRATNEQHRRTAFSSSSEPG